MIILLNEFFEYPYENRNVEIAQALRKNCECDDIDKIVVFCDPLMRESLKAAIEGMSHLHSDKIQTVITRPFFRSTYADYFNYCNQNFTKNDVCVIANNDIYFDESVAKLNDIDDQFVCLSRWQKYGAFAQIPGHPAYSQDVWAFRGKIPDSMILTSYFFQGTMCCDNHICFLAMVNGFKVVNPCLAVKSYHLHEEAKHRIYDTEDREIKNCIYLATVDKSDSLEYDAFKVAAYWGAAGNYRMGGPKWMKQMRDIYHETGLFEKLYEYNMLKLKDPTKRPTVQGVTDGSLRGSAFSNLMQSHHQLPVLTWTTRTKDNKND